MEPERIFSHGQNQLSFWDEISLPLCFKGLSINHMNSTGNIAVLTLYILYDRWLMILRSLFTLSNLFRIIFAYQEFMTGILILL